MVTHELTSSTCAAGVCDPQRTQGSKRPAPRGEHVLVHLIGPGTFVGAQVIQQGGLGQTSVRLDIDSRNVSNVSFAGAQSFGLTQQNPFGVVLFQSPTHRNLTIGFPTPLAFAKELKLSVNVQDDGVGLIVADVIHGTASPTPVGLTAVSLNPATVEGGTPSTGTVTLSGSAAAGGVVVALASSNAAVATVPANVTVPAGSTSTTFPVITQAVATPVEISITASVEAVSRQATLSVAPPVSLSAASLNPPTVVGGQFSTGTVSLSGAAFAGGAVVTLASSNTAAATVPASVLVPAGSTSATFQVTTQPVATTTQVVITAISGGITRQAALTVNSPALTAVSLNPGTVIGGTSSTGTVTLNGKAPAGGAVVTLSSSSSVATVAASVQVTAGTSSATFPINTQTVAAPIQITITATFGGNSRQATLTVDTLGGGKLKDEDKEDKDVVEVPFGLIEPPAENAISPESHLSRGQAFIRADERPEVGRNLLQARG